MDNNKMPDIFGLESNPSELDFFNKKPIQQPKKTNKKTITIISLVVVLVIVGSFVGGIFIGANSGMGSDMPLLLETYRLVKKYYYRDINWAEFQEIASAAFAGSIDPFTGIYVGSATSSMYKIGIELYNNVYNEHYIGNIYDNYEIATAQSGKFDRDANEFVIDSDSVNIEIGDRLYAIGYKKLDGTIEYVNVENSSTSVISSVINMSPDGNIILQVVKQDDEKIVNDNYDNQPENNTILPDKTEQKQYPLRSFYFQMSSPNEETMYAKYYSSSQVGQGVGLIKYTSFDDLSIAQYTQAVKDFINDPDKPTKLILDLRHNGGGDSKVLGFVANSLINNTTNAKLPIARFVGNTGYGKMSEKFFTTESEYTDANNVTSRIDYVGNHIQDFECVVLVDSSSASSSEALVGAMQYYNNTTIVGNTTFGKGVAQTGRRLSNGQTIYITNGYYYIPTKDASGKLIWEKNIHEIGFSPLEENYVNSLPKRMSDDDYVKRAIQVLMSE